MSPQPSLAQRGLAALESLFTLPVMVVHNMLNPRHVGRGLPQEYIQDTKLVCSRTELLERIPSGGVIAELGVDEGNFSAQIIEQCKPDKLYLIDMWGSQRFSTRKMKAVQQRFASQIQSGQVEIIRGDSVEELSRLPNASLDWVYIDTTHEYHRTLQELRLANDKVKPGGLIAGHDYTIGNISKFLPYGVIAAVNEFCIEKNWQLEYLTNEPGRYLTFVLAERKPADTGA